MWLSNSVGEIVRQKDLKRKLTKGQLKKGRTFQEE